MEDYPDLKKGDFVRVSWTDIVAESGWESYEKDEDDGKAVHACQSYGFVTRKNKTFVTVSATKGVNGGVEYNQSINIPWKSVENVEVLKVS
jgi:hypothetical protein